MVNPQHSEKVGAHSNQETRPRNSFLPKPTVAPDSQSPHTGRKRKNRTLSPENQPEPLNHTENQAKRPRTSSRPPTTSPSSRNSSWLNWDRAEREYWDSLSRLWLTPNALRELNRRNALLRVKALPTSDLPVNHKHRPRDIIHFARHGGPDLSDIRKYRNPEEGSSTAATMPPRGSGTEKKSSAYDPEFAQHLADNYVFRSDRKQVPSNHQDWKEVMAQPRASLSPSRSSNASFNSFVSAVGKARNEDEVMRNVFPRVIGKNRPPSGQNVQFKHLTALTPKIVVAKPDYYEGYSPGPGNRTIRERLDTDIVPSSRTELPFLPTFFAEAKGPDGSISVAERQVRHDGALGARAMHSLQTLGRRENYDNKAYTASAILHGNGTLHMYTHHMRQPSGHGTPAHTHMTPIGSWCLDHSPQTYREGRTAFRNTSDKTYHHREHAIQRANRRLGIETPEGTQIAQSSRRRPSRHAAPVKSDPSSSSEEEDSDDGNHETSSVLQHKRKPLKPKVISVAPGRPARKDSSPESTVRRRKAIVYSECDPSVSSEEEPSRASRQSHLSKARIITAAPGRPGRRDSSPEPTVRRRKAIVYSECDPSVSSDEEPSRASPQSKARIITVTPKRPARRDPSPPTRNLRPRKVFRRL